MLNSLRYMICHIFCDIHNDKNLVSEFDGLHIEIFLVCKGNIEFVSILYDNLILNDLELSDDINCKIN